MNNLELVIKERTALLDNLGSQVNLFKQKDFEPARVIPAILSQYQLSHEEKRICWETSSL